MPEPELLEWKRTLLSAPCCFERFDTDDARFAEANKIRNELGGIAKLVVFSARQTVYNIWGFNMKKEAALGREFFAAEIAKFREERQIASYSGAEALHKKSVIDACLTLFKRMFCLPACENILRESEEEHGADSPWNAIWKLQEIVYRAQRGSKIVRLMRGIQDAISSTKLGLK